MTILSTLKGSINLINSLLTIKQNKEARLNQFADASEADEIADQLSTLNDVIDDCFAKLDIIKALALQRDQLKAEAKRNRIEARNVSIALEAIRLKNPVQQVTVKSEPKSEPTSKKTSDLSYLLGTEVI